jgi:hypothetical protein
MISNVKTANKTKLALQSWIQIWTCHSSQDTLHMLHTVVLKLTKAF